MKKIIIADNQYITRFAISTLIKQYFGEYIEKYKYINSDTELTDSLKKDPSSWVLIDINSIEGLSANRLIIIQDRFPQTKWLHFSDEFTPSLLLTQGSLCNIHFLYKQSSEKICIKTLDAFLQNYEYTDEKTQESIDSARSERDSNKTTELTNSEKNILKLIANGLSAKEIAEKRFTSVMTVQTQKKNLYKKLGINSNYEAIGYAIRSGIVNTNMFYL